MLSKEDQIRKENSIARLKEFNNENELAIAYRKHLSKAEDYLDSCETRLNNLKYKLAAGVMLISVMIYMISMLSTTKDFINTIGLYIISIVMLIITFMTDKTQCRLEVNEAESRILRYNENLLDLYKTTNKVVKYIYSDKDTVDSLIDILEKSDAITVDEAIRIYKETN